MNEKESVYMKVYKGKQFSRKSLIPYKKVIAFDLDETLGSFNDLEILWRKVQYFEPRIDFNTLLDMYPEFLRDGILSILDFLYQMKQSGQCENIYIYTNNQCSPQWVKYFTNYFNYKLHCEKDLFDKVIHAFKINNRRVEFWRTTHSKTYDDFIKCTLLPKSTEICFIDNSYFAEMNRERVYYIKPSSYYHSLSTKCIIDRFTNSYSIPSGVFVNRNQIHDLLKQHFSQHGRAYNMTIRYFSTPEIHRLVAEKMMYHIKEFLYTSQKWTRKIRFPLGRFTRKKRKYII